MIEKLEKIKSNLLYLFSKKFSYVNKNRLLFVMRLIKEIPNIVKFLFKDLSREGILGSIVSLDSSVMCQLKCPMCPSVEGLSKEGVLGWGYLRFNDFKNFVENNPSIKKIELSNSGEPFLNPELNQIIKYSYLKNVNLYIGTGANLNSVTKDVLESLVKYKVKTLNVSLDGATNETYKIYRIGGDLNKVLRNIKTINYFKKKYQSKFPKLLWQFVIMGHNEHELLNARNMAKKLGMSFYTKLNRVSSYSPVKNEKYVRKESGLGVANRREFVQKYKRLYINACLRLWNSPQINWDGKLLGCNVNMWDHFGNVFKTSLKQCLESERYIYAKQMVLGKKKARKDIPCSRCPSYKIIKHRSLKKSDIIINHVTHTQNTLPSVKVRFNSQST